MTGSTLRPLAGTRIWLSGSIPDEATDTEKDSIRKFIGHMSAAIFREGGSIIHGSHPTIWPTLLRAASTFQGVRDSRDYLALAVSRYFSREPENFGIELDAWRTHSTVHEIPEAAGNDAKSKSVEALRHWIAERSDAVVLLGGKWWQQDPGGAGIPAEFRLARERGLPCFILGGFGGAAAGYLEHFPEMVRNLKNGLDEDKNREIATEHQVDTLVDLVVHQLCRLPLIRGKTETGSTFRILALDGGGIKGTFTAAVLYEWERLTKTDLATQFDLVAGTSTGGILAVGLGMGLTAKNLLAFYEERGPLIFPVTSLGSKLSYGLRSLVQPKFPQDTLRRELERAFEGAAGKHLRDSRCRLVIPTCHARSGDAYLFRTNHHPDLITDADRTATEVALATAAAPTYFHAAEVGGSYYVDGGVWANNPALAAFVEAAARLRTPVNHIDILSVGTTSAPYSGEGTLTSGLAGWLWKGRIIELLMHAQAQGISQLTNSLADRVRLLRVDQTLVPGEVSLDSVNRIDGLKDYGAQAARQPDMLREVTARFLNGIPTERWTRYP